MEEEDGTTRPATMQELVWLVREAQEEDLPEKKDDGSTNATAIVGFDSGATATVAIIHENRLFVANAGDSRYAITLLVKS